MLLIILPLIILLFLTIFSIIFGATFTSVSIDTFVSNSIINNGTTTTIGLGGDDIYFNIDPLIGATVWIIAIIILAALISIKFVGSGMGPEGVRTTLIGTAYGTVWIVLSVYSNPLISQIEIFGPLLYVSFTIMYALGVIRNLSN